MGKTDHQTSLSFSQDSIHQAVDKLVSAAKELVKKANTEEDLRIGFVKTLDPVCVRLGITAESQYEKTIYTGGRSDEIRGRVIIEYERPCAFRSQRWIEHAFDQLVVYIQGEVATRKDTLFLFDPKYVGVGFDGEQIFFVRYKGDKSKPKTSLHKDDFSLLGPYNFDSQSAATFLTYLRALSRKLLTADTLSKAFGPSGKAAPLAVSAFADALKNWGNARVTVFFNEWKRLFGIVYGEHFSAHQAEEAEALSKLYGVGKETGFQEMLFSVHTYFALLMKLIATEIITLKESSFSSSFCHGLTHASKKELKAQLEDIESGGLYSRRGITNFLEGDFFCWYLEAFSSPRMEEAIRAMARELSEFEPATTIIDPDSTRDLLKKLYQYLVPQEVRHKLGEYYTPDWLAELVFEEVGYDGNTLKRFLDPAGGSGTFIVQAIKLAKEYGKKHKEPPRETVKRIVANIWGFDLNPLAVIASRTNYIFALGELISEVPTLEIPIYLADSVLWPEQRGQLKLGPQGESIPIATSVQTFFVPKIWINGNGLLMREAAPLIEKMVKDRYSPSEAMESFRAKGLVFPPHEQVVESFYSALLKLEEQGKNSIWARFLKNAFAPMICGKFDYVLGNPPWIRWGYLSEEYRRETLQFWHEYGLFSLKGHAARLGGGEKDFSMLFTYAAIDHYLKKNGKLGFLITQEVFKSKGAGEGFRRFRLGEEEKGNFKVLQAHDLVTVQPFEGAANKTAMIVVKKGDKTTYPIPYTEWKRKKKVGRIPTDFTLESALPLLEKKKLQAQPMGSPTGSWQTVSKSQENLKVIKGENAYKARRGASTEPYGVFWLEITQALSHGNLIVRNLADRGKRNIHHVEETVEPDLIYPAVSGADIDRWRATPSIYILMSQDPETCEPFPESKMKSNWPRTYSYLTKFKDVLLSRGSKTVRQLAERTAFYAMFGIGEYTVARYKVVWKRMASDLVAAVISLHKTPFGFKTIISTDTTSLFATDNEAEAHYLCAIINSTSVRDFIKSYSSAGRGFGAPSVMSHVGIPKFDPKNSIHIRLCELSKTLHEKAIDASYEAQKEVQKLEGEVDRVVGELFGIEK